MSKSVKIANGWVVEIEEAETGKGYLIKRILALFGHGIYHPIDTSKFTQGEWDLYHMYLEGALK